MFVWFEDWSSFLLQVRKDLPRGSHLLKVFASPTDPRSSGMYHRGDIAIFEVDGSPFQVHETFDYDDRGTYTGQDIEQELQGHGLGQSAAEAIRALFRFAHTLGAVRVAMGLTGKDGAPVITHPLDEVDLGAVRDNLDDPTRPHLDIFTPASLERVTQLIRVSTLDNRPQIVSLREHMELERRCRNLEGADRSPARRK